MKLRFNSRVFFIGLICLFILMQFCCPILRAQSQKTNRNLQRIISRNFTQVEILLNSQFTLADISDLQCAPGSNVEVLDNPSRVKAQIPLSQSQALAAEGVQPVVLNNFVLAEGYSEQTNAMEKDAYAKATCSGSYYYGEWPSRFYIPSDGDLTIAGLDFSGITGSVTCIDVHYEIQSSVGFVNAYIGPESSSSFPDDYYRLVDGVAGSINETQTGITMFNGEPVGQTWELWVYEDWGTGNGYVDSWWVKLYYVGDYCSTSTTYNTDEHISHVQVGDIDNISGSSGYVDYTAYSTEMQIDQSYGITVTNGTPYHTDECGIWVDWNQDSDFDASEAITVSGGPGVFSATITPPGSAAEGETRMRIRIVDASYGALSPCGPATYGEVEDYTIEVVAPPPGKITGNKFNDLDGDGNWDGAEDGIEGWEIYLDLNDNGQYETTEPNVITGPDGFYEFAGLLAGTYVVAEMDRVGWRQTLPGGNGTYTLTVDPNEVVENVNFGNFETGASFISIPVTEDTYADSGNPDTNYGSSGSLSSGYNGSAIYRTFLKFDLSGIPPGNVITSATLRLDNNFISIPAPELDVYRVSDRWEESTVTWNDQPVNAYTPGPPRPIEINRSLVIGAYTTWNVTEEVDDQYVDDGVYSVKIVSPYEDISQSAGFWSKDAGIPDWAPTLEIEYMPVFGGGSGEPDDPYQIWTPEQFNTIGLHANRWSKHFKLMDDISMAEHSGSSYRLIGTSTSMNPVEGNEFRGVFDGNYHTISDFSNSKGVFGYVYEATIKSLKLDSPDISSSNDSVGGIAGSVDNTNIMNCSVIGGTVSGNNRVGGFVGYCSGSHISDCSSSASVSGGDYVGGFIGSPSFFGGGGVISNCYAAGSVGGINYVGGFMGDSTDTTVINCYSAGLVTGTTDVGAFFGYNNNRYTLEDTAFDCFWDSDVNPTLPAIGNIADPCSLNITDPCRIIGESTANMQTQSTFINAGWDFILETANGGSDDWAMIPGGGSYPVLWHELPFTPPLPSFAGGSGTAADPYLIETETQLNSIGHNSRLMDKHFRLISDLEMDGLRYYMIAPEPYVFSGTFDGNGHKISNILLEPLFDFSSFGFIANIKGDGASMQDLTLIDPNINSDWGWGVGSLAGKNEGGTITNCHTVNANIRGWAGVGGLVGVNYYYGVISGCSATGNVSENTFMSPLFSCVGGLVGENTFWSEIENSFAKCNVSGEDCLGGLVGESVIYSPITNCYADSNVTGTADYIGGLVGRFGGSSGITYCYSSSVVTGPDESDSVGGLVGGKISSAANYYTACFWDSQINPDLTGIGNATDPCGIIGESTANMQTQTTFTSVGWDFLGETTNGTEDVWAVLEGIDYPAFVWQGPLAVSLDIDHTWMYQNVLSGTKSKLTADVSIPDDPFNNSGYSYAWEIILPDDVTVAPAITAGGGDGDTSCTFAAPSCNEPGGISDSGRAFTVRVTVTGDDFGNTGTAEAQFGIALLGDINNDAKVNVQDRALINSFWRTGSAANCTFRDCNIRCDSRINVIDRAVLNAVWRGRIGSNQASAPCPLR
ncbi:MAG: DNRLRE domain-containing protein [Planctomycetota bacterium]